MIWMSFWIEMRKGLKVPSKQELFEENVFCRAYDTRLQGV